MDAATKAALKILLQGDEPVEVKSKNEKKVPLHLADIKSYIEKIKEYKASLEQQTKFKIGDLVVWKEMMRNRRYPDYGQPGIVLRIIEDPKPEADPENPELYDIQIGYIVIDEDDDETAFLSYNVNSSRFKEYKEEDAK